jgi:hypothetical protein
MKTIIYNHLEKGGIIEPFIDRIYSMGNRIQIRAILIVLILSSLFKSPSGYCCNMNIQSLPDLNVKVSFRARNFGVSPINSSQGGILHLTVFDVQNIGSQNCGSFSLGAYLSLDNQITSTDIKLKSQTINGIEANGNRVVDLGVLIIPDNTPIGTYYIGIYADDGNNVNEENENNNTLLSSSNLNINSPLNADIKFVNLPIQVGNFPNSNLLFGIGCSIINYGNDNNLLSVAPSCNLKFYYSIGNFGNEDVTEFNISYYLSPDNINPSNDFSFASEKVEGLKAGEVKFIFKDLKLPQSTPPGDYYVGVALDSQNQIKEVSDQNSENNNLKIRQLRIMDIISDNTPIFRARIRIKTADVQDAGTDSNVLVSLGCNTTYLDYAQNDFERNSSYTYDLIIPGNFTYGDLSSLSIRKEGDDDWCLSEIELELNYATVFTYSFQTNRWVYDGDKIVFGYSDLRFNPNWSATLTEIELGLHFAPFHRDDLSSIIQSIVGNSMYNQDVYWRDGANVEITYNTDNSVKVSLPLSYSVSILPDPNLEMTFNMTFSCDCDGIKVAISDLNLDLSTYGEVLKWVWNYIVTDLVNLVPNMFNHQNILFDINLTVSDPNLQAQNIDNPIPFCPKITVTSNADIDFNPLAATFTDASLELSFPPETKPGSSIPLKFTVTNVGTYPVSNYHIEYSFLNIFGDNSPSYGFYGMPTISPCQNNSFHVPAQYITLPEDLTCNVKFKNVSLSKDPWQLSLTKSLIAPEYEVQANLFYFPDNDISNNTIKQRINIGLPDIFVQAKLKTPSLNRKKYTFSFQISNIGVFNSGPIHIWIGPSTQSPQLGDKNAYWAGEIKKSIAPGEFIRENITLDKGKFPAGINSVKITVFPSDYRRECDYKNNEAILTL